MNYYKLFRDWTYLIILFLSILFILYRSPLLTGLLVLIIIFSYMVDSMVEYMKDIKILKFRLSIKNRPLAILLSYFILFLFIVFFALYVIPSIGKEFIHLYNSLPSIINKSINNLESLINKYNITIPDNVYDRIINYTKNFTTYIFSLLKFSLNTINHLFNMLSNIIYLLIMVPLISFYILSDKEKIAPTLLKIVPTTFKNDFKIIGERLNHLLKEYIKGQILLCVIIGVLTFLSLLFILPKYSLMLSLIAGITEAIPIVGPIIAAIPAMIIGFVYKPIYAIYIALIYFVIQQLESYIIVPKVMQDVLQLHPATLMLFLVVMGSLFGFVGVFAAVPLIAVGKVILMYIADRVND